MKNDTISIAKAIGIILMLVGHAGCPQALNSFIYQFHMPLFFFFSGYCFKDKYLNDFRSFAVKRVKGIYVPFVKYALLFLLLHNVFFRLNIYNDIYGYNGGVSSLYSLSDIVKRVIKITTSMSYEEQLLGGYWFLRVLFYTSFIGYGFFKCLRNGKMQFLGVILLYAITILFTFSDSLSSFWQTISLSCLAAIFFVVGKKLSECKLPQQGWLTLICLCATFALSRINPVGMTTRDPMSITLYVMGALLGVLMVRNFSIYMQKSCWLKKAMVYIGDHTLPILTWHFLSFKLVSLIIIKVYNLPIENLAHFPVIQEYSSRGWWIGYTLVGLVVSFVMIVLSESISEKVESVRQRFQQGGMKGVSRAG
jgi:fucose 4-O-acetylase-like acetyltransferase